MAEELVKSNESKTLEIIDLMKRIDQLISATKADSQCIKRKHIESNSVDAGQVTISGFKIGANIGRGSVHVMTAIEEPASAVFTASAKFATKTAGIALASLGVIVDVIDLVVTSKNVYEGSISEMAEKLRSEVSISLISISVIILVIKLLTILIVILNMIVMLNCLYA